MSFSQIANVTASNGLNPQQYFDMSVSSILKSKTTDGISGWVFDVPETEEVNVEADITDHFMEDNSVIADHIIIKPIIITLTGFKGELVYKKGQGVYNLTSLLQDKLQAVDAYLGKYNPGATQAIQQALSKLNSVQNTVAQQIQKTQNIINQFSYNAKTQQEIAYKQLYSMMKSKQIVTVQTPWQFFDNMIIQNIRPSQDNTTNQESSFTVVLKEWRIAKTTTTLFNNALYSNRNEVQTADKSDAGKQQGTKKTFLLSAVEAFHQ